MKHPALWLLFALLTLFTQQAQADELTSWLWDSEARTVEELRTFTYGYDQTLTLERVSKGKGILVSMSRIQLRDQDDRIVAYTPSRVTAIPFCFIRQACWVFMWKTVYPLPAIYKFNIHPDKWARNPQAPMIYTRRGGGDGFTEQFNPFFGIFGLILLFFDKIFYVCVCILMSLALSLQVVKYHDLPEYRKLWIKRIFMMMSGLLPGPFVLNPMTVTAILISIWGIVGTFCVGITFVNTIGIIFVTFTLCALRLARAKAAAR